MSTARSDKLTSHCMYVCDVGKYFPLRHYRQLELYQQTAL